MFVNGELFFPLGVSTTYSDQDLELINNTHINIIFSHLTKVNMDKIYSTFQGKVKVIYILHYKSFLIPDPNTIKQKEENYKKYIFDTINEFKDHPALLSWYVNDELFSFYNKDIRNMTLTAHELDPNHPTYSIIMGYGEMLSLLNTSDMFGLDSYPIGGADVRDVTTFIGKESEEPLGKPNIPCLQIYDRYAYKGILVMILLQESQCHPQYRK